MPTVFRPVSLIALVSAIAILLFSAATASARDIFDSFSYTFDTEGELHDFTHNDPDNGKVLWQAGGANDSKGSLKVTGPVATFERFDFFRANNSTLSFAYKVNGYQRFRVRLNVAPVADHVKKMGSYLFVTIPPGDPGEWNVASIKLSTLKGTAAGKPSVYPELVFKSLTFIADEPEGNDPYLLIDEIKFGGAMRSTTPHPTAPKASDHGVTSKPSSGRNASRTLLDFETPDQVTLLRPDENTTVSHSTEGATEGKHALKMVCKKGLDYTTIEFAPQLIKNWQNFDYLSLDFTTEDTHIVTWTPEFWDAKTKNYHTRSTYEGQAGMKVVPVHPGRTRMLIDLRVARRNGKEGLEFHELKPADKIDFSQLTKFKAWFKTTGLPDDYVVYLDNVRLVQEGALDSKMKLAVPGGARAFDFGGDDTPLVDGFTQVTPQTVYNNAIGFGFASSEGLTAAGRDWPDPLTGDYVTGRADEGKPGNPFEFRVDVPPGEYRVWLVAGAFPRPNAQVSLTLQGESLLKGDLSTRELYTTQWLYRCLPVDYSEKPNALWRNYVTRLYPVYLRTVKVADEGITIQARDAFLSSLLVMPAAGKAEFDAFASASQSERIRYFYQDLYVNRPANEPGLENSPGFGLFVAAAGRELMPWSGASDKDSAKLDWVATPGELVVAQIGVRPNADGALRLEVSDLKGWGGIIPAESVSVYLKRYLSNGHQVNSWCLVPGEETPIEKNLTRSFWIGLRVAKEVKAGRYAGTITARAVVGGEDATQSVEHQIPIALEVFPFKLDDNIPLSAGFFYGGPDGGQFVGYNQLPDFQAERDKILASQMKLMKALGLTSVEIPAPGVTRAGADKATLDFSGMEKAARAAQAAGLLANEGQPAIAYTLGIGRTLGRRLIEGGRFRDVGDELQLPAFAPNYTSAVEQMVAWSKEKKVPLVQWIVDEPRETPNPWNRNLADTITYLDLAGKVPGAVRMVTPMGDVNSGKDYTILLDHVDIIATHAGKSSAKFIERAMAKKKPELWIYNSGKDRFSNGFYIWRVGAAGKFEWHFNQWVQPNAKDAYPGSDLHNPFLNYEFSAAGVPAPLDVEGSVFPTEGLLTMSQGLADYRYLVTLERTIAAAKISPAKRKLVAEAEEFLTALKKVIPVLPEVKNLAREEDLALVGGGIQGAAVERVDAWRRKIAEFTAALLK